jgi:hypothetical protein
MSILHIRDPRTNENPQKIPNGLQNQTGGRRTQNLKICDTDRKIKRQGLLQWPTSDNRRSGMSED